jgi:hypothetical protein
MAVLFLVLEDLPTVFHSCTNLHSHQQCIWVPFSPHSCQHLLLFVFLMVAILRGVRWNLNMVLIWVSFMARDGEHLFMCFLAIGLLLLQNCCSVHLPIRSWIFGSLVFWAPCMFWLSVPCLVYSWQRFSSNL